MFATVAGESHSAGIFTLPYDEGEIRLHDLNDLRPHACLTPSDLQITLHGDLDTILNWVVRTGKSGCKAKPEIASSRLSVSVKGRTCSGHPRLIVLKKDM